jgi:N-acetyl-anhydromuramyl-L-alanine amidase AmpD
MGLVICGQEHEIETEVRSFRQTGWDATIPNCVQAGSIPVGCPNAPYPFAPASKTMRTERFGARHAIRQFGKDASKIPLDAVQAAVKMFVVHFDGLATSDQCFHVLHNERGLSCHFLVDNDGVIYQTLDLALTGFHASEFNPVSVGVEFANRGEWEGTGKDGHYYADKKRFPDDHPESWCVIRNTKVHCYGFTEPQMRAFGYLAKALTKFLPNIALDYPQDLPGHVNRGLVLPNAWGFSGYIGHFHLTERKWDPGPFDFKGFIDKVRGSLCFPCWTGKVDKPEAKPEIPESIDELEERTQALYDQNEHKAEGGYFPVGPWGDSRLWHGGVHIPQSGSGAGPASGPAQPIFAPFPGRAVLARMGKDSSVGSCNFVLLKHEMTVGPKKLRFYSLYMHLEDESKGGGTPPKWMTGDTWTAKQKKGEPIPFDEPVEAGEIIGRFGIAGPSDTSKRQIHFEIFSKEPLFDEDDAKWWTPVDGSATGRFCEVPEVIQPIDVKETDGKLSHDEITEFFDSSGDRESFRKLVTYNVSEWTDRPDWAESLRTPPDFKDLPANEIDALVEEQIAPGLWWTAEVAKAVRLPPDGMVYHYHPITFIEWINEKILEAASDPNAQNDAAAATTTGAQGMTADFEEGSDMNDMFNEDVADGRDPYNDAIDMPHLIEGYDGAPDLEQ